VDRPTGVCYTTGRNELWKNTGKHTRRKENVYMVIFEWLYSVLGCLVMDLVGLLFRL
jgi:hypothetical protein